MYSNFDIFHVMLRGIGHMDLFYDDADYSRFLKILAKYTAELNVPVFAYCLMTNHVHLLIRAKPDVMALLFKKIGVSYAYYFNSRHEHVGHLFQNRYVSEAIDNARYFQAAIRYILLNPSASGLGDWRSYRWSSASAYLKFKNDGITNCSLAMEMIGGSIGFDEVLNGENEIALAEPSFKHKRKNDEEIIAEIRSLSGLSDPLALQTADLKRRNEILSAAKAAGATVRQLERVTGINRNIIQRV